MACVRKPTRIADVLRAANFPIQGTSLVLTDCGRYQSLATVRLGIDDEDESEETPDLAEAESAS
jgi:hypothetical protein